MARPLKQGLEYFPVDVDFFSDMKVRRIKKDCGPSSVSILLCLLCNIYRDGYYIGWNEDVCFVIADIVGVTEGAVSETISKAVSVGFFSGAMYSCYKILTSAGIQKRYLHAVKSANRKKEDIKTDYNLLVSSEETLVSSEETLVSSEETLVSSEETLVSSEESAQRKGKERKGKEIKEEETKNKKNQYAEFVSMTDDEHLQLVDKVGEVGTMRCIEILDNYKGSSGKKYKSDYRAILTWVLNRYFEETTPTLVSNRTVTVKPKGNPDIMDMIKQGVFDDD